MGGGGGGWPKVNFGICDTKHVLSVISLYTCFYVFHVNFFSPLLLANFRVFIKQIKIKSLKMEILILEECGFLTKWRVLRFISGK